MSDANDLTLVQIDARIQAAYNQIAALEDQITALTVGGAGPGYNIDGQSVGSGASAVAQLQTARRAYEDSILFWEKLKNRQFPYQFQSRGR